ncbi:small integral membrane protein 30 [Anomaloglossus baeobatrachus]|uniref:small integral membrane protein 30 n=1 Tax=Anomaloglossus baeobatrachus TaxID=238106 RepID=UPI003F50067C
MAFSGPDWKLPSVLVSLIFLLPGAEAMDEGDAIAMLLGVVIVGIGFCACLGYYARSRERHY